MKNMTFMDAVSLIVKVAGQFSPAFALFYFLVVMKEKIIKPASPYKITEEEHEAWCSRRLLLNSLLCILYAVIFMMYLLQWIWGFFIFFVILLVVYVLRVKNNLKYVK